MNPNFSVAPTRGALARAAPFPGGGHRARGSPSPVAPTQGAGKGGSGSGGERRDGDAAVPFILAGWGRPAHLPYRPARANSLGSSLWSLKRLRASGSGRERRWATEHLRGGQAPDARCSGPGGAWRRRPPPARESAPHPLPAHLRLPPIPASATGWKRPRRGPREVCDNFSIPRATRAGAQVGAQSLC